MTPEWRKWKHGMRNIYITQRFAENCGFILNNLKIEDNKEHWRIQEADEKTDLIGND